METINFPYILSEQINDQQAHFDFTLPSELIYFQGHFDSLPLLPGVVQIHWVMDLAKKLSDNLIFGGMSRVKFMRPIRPEQNLSLELTLNPDNNLLSFRYYDESTTYSSGRINTNGQHV